MKPCICVFVRWCLCFCIVLVITTIISFLLLCAHIDSPLCFSLCTRKRTKNAQTHKCTNIGPHKPHSYWKPDGVNINTEFSLFEARALIEALGLLLAF
jgi:hypothetical protein